MTSRVFALMTVLQLLACGGASGIMGSVALDGIENARGVTVSVWQYGEVVAETESAANGRYQLSVPAGIYEVVLHDEWSLEREFRFDRVLVESEHLTTLPLRTFTPTGRIIAENLRPLADCPGFRLSTSVAESPDGGSDSTPVSDTSDELRVALGGHMVVLSYGAWSTTVEAVVSERAGTTTIVAPTNPPTTSSVQGRALVQQSGIAYSDPGVPVTLSGTCTRSTATDPQGNFAFGALPAGGFAVSHPPPPSTFAPVVIGDGMAPFLQRFDLSQGQSMDLFSMPWVPFGIVKGRVVSQIVPDGGYEICGDPPLALPPLRTWGPVSVAHTDIDGRYELWVRVDVTSVGLCGPRDNGTFPPKQRLPLSNAVSVSSGYNQVTTAPDIVVP